MISIKTILLLNVHRISSLKNHLIFYYLHSFPSHTDTEVMLWRLLADHQALGKPPCLSPVYILCVCSVLGRYWPQEQSHDWFFLRLDLTWYKYYNAAVLAQRHSVHLTSTSTLSLWFKLVFALFPFECSRVKQAKLWFVRKMHTPIKQRVNHQTESVKRSPTWGENEQFSSPDEKVLTLVQHKSHPCELVYLKQLLNRHYDRILFTQLFHTHTQLQIYVHRHTQTQIYMQVQIRSLPLR